MLIFCCYPAERAFVVYSNICPSQANCKQIKSHLTILLYLKRENCHLVRFLANDKAQKEQKGIL